MSCLKWKRKIIVTLTCLTNLILSYNICLVNNGGGGEFRNLDENFAGSCLTSWLHPHNKKFFTSFDYINLFLSFLSITKIPPTTKYQRSSCGTPLYIIITYFYAIFHIYSIFLLVQSQVSTI